MSPIALPVIWTPNALQDLHQRYLFLLEKDMEIAKKMASHVLQYAERLESTPNIGRPAHDLEPEYRELLIPFGGSGYLLLYEVLYDKILVLAFRHQREVE